MRTSTSLVAAVAFSFVLIPVRAGPQTLVAPRADHTRLLYWRDDAGREQPVQTAQDWSRRRQDILRGMQEAMGALPDRSHLPSLDVKVTQETKGDGVVRQTISLAADDHERIPAYLFLPDPLPRGRLPAVLALHPTSPIGKGEVAGLGKANRGYGVELARRGYIVICPDYPSFGDYACDFGDGRYESGTMRGIFNHMRCVDLLQSMPQVDPQRIGAIGHSLGGHNAMFLGAFDERVRAIVSSCGWTPFADYYGGKIDGWTSLRYMPRLRHVYKLDPGAVPFDFYEVVAALAPQPFLSISPTRDSNFAVAGVKKGIVEARKVYDLLGASKSLQVRYPECEHDFPPDERTAAYAFLDAALKAEPAKPVPAKPVPAAEIPDLKDELPRTPPHEPAEALSTIKVLPPFHVEQVAAEPVVCSPVACDFDENGRLFVCEMIDYPEEGKGTVGRIRVLEDTDGDGKYDKSTVFLDNVPWPTAILCWDGGVFVGSAPDILYCKDTDGDGKADSRKVVFTGFNRHNVQGLLNCFRWGLDNRIHGATSSCGGNVVVVQAFQPATSQPAGKPALQLSPIPLSGRDFSFDPRKLDLRASPPQAGKPAPQFGDLRPESGGAQHGLSYDDWGCEFVSSNSDHIQMVMFEDRYLARNPLLAAGSARQSIAADGGQAEVFRISPVEPWRIVRTRLRVSGAVRGPIEGGGRPAGYFSGSTGVTIYRGDAWPSEYLGQAFVGDVGSNIVHRKVLEPNGVGFVAKRVDAGREFLASSDIWFRPVQFANAPDGNLYVLDCYREVIEHPASLPPEIKKYLDLTAGRDRGRIYRVAPEGFKQRPRPKLGSATTAELVATLEHRNGWHRDTAARLLFQREDRSAIPLLERLARESKIPEARMHALYALSGLGALSPQVVLERLSDEHPRVREHAVGLSESVAKSPEVVSKLCTMADDVDARVRYQLAFSLGEVQGNERNAALVKILKLDVAGKWVRLAVGSSLTDGAAAVLTDLAGDVAFRASDDGREVLQQLAAQVGSRGRPDDVSAVLKTIESLPADQSAFASSLMKGLSQGMTRSGVNLRDRLTPGGKADGMLRDLLESARKTAGDAKSPRKARVEAIRTLALGSFADHREILGGLLSGKQPQDLQLTAIAALDAFRDPAVGPILVDAWRKLTPKVRTTAADAIYSRPERLAVLLDAVQAGKIPTTELDASRLRAMGSRGDAALQQKIKTTLASMSLGRRQDVIAAYRGALNLKGDAAKGRETFQKTCAACHKLDGVGTEIGPSLAAMQGRGPEAILVNVLDPNLEVNPQFAEYVVDTSDGRTLTGLLAAETATSVTLKRAGGESDTILRSDIEKIRSSGLSLMPEGLEKQFDTQGLADLIAYIMTAK